MARAPDRAASSRAASSRTAPSRAASRPAGRARVLLWLAGDLLSIPFHLVVFLCTRSRHRRELRRALEDAAP
jgi:hypothetical protein